jgi:DNA-directed RNA polymerase specialized sigma24 family protein
MDSDTDLGGSAAAFPLTQRSLVRAAADPDPRVRHQAQEALVAAYWKPVYKYLRLRWQLSNEDAKDATQGFLARVLERDFCAAFDPSRARFRTYVRICADGFVANGRQAAGRQKRGGNVTVLPLDFEAADGEVQRLTAPADTDLDEFFRREWVRELFALAVDDLHRLCAAAGKSVQFALFERYDLDGPDASQKLTYAELAAEFGLPVTQVTNHLASARRQFRRLIVERLRATTANAEEFAEEARRLFGADLP